MYTYPNPIVVFAYFVKRFYITDSVSTVTKYLPKDDVFEIISLLPQIIMDLDVICGE